MAINYDLNNTGPEVQDRLDQTQVNEQAIADLQEAVGTGGSVDTRIEAAKEEIIGDASTDYDTLGKVEGKVTTLEDAVGTGGSVDSRIEDAKEDVLSQVYTKDETYTKQQVNNLVTTPEVEYVTVTATDQTTDVTDLLPATGESDTIYRVGKWDGTQYDISYYSEYGWDGTEYQLLDVKANGIADAEDFDNPTNTQKNYLATVGSILDSMDTTPTAGSGKPVQSGGVAEYVGYPSLQFDESWEGNVPVGIYGSIPLKKGITYTFNATRTDSSQDCYFWIVEEPITTGSPNIYVNLGMSKGESNKTVVYTPDSDIIGYILVRGTYGITNPHLTVTAYNNHLIWSSEQSLSSDEKKQVIKNLGFGDGQIDSTPVKSSTRLMNSGGIFIESQKLKALTVDTRKGYIKVDGKFFANNNSGCYIIRVIPGLKYKVSLNTGVTTTFKYCVFTSDIEGEIPVGTRFVLEDNVFTAPSGSEYLFVCYNYDGNGSEDDVNVREYTFIDEDIDEALELIPLKENVSNKVTEFSETPSDTKYPSEKLVYDEVYAPLNEITTIVQSKNVYDYDTVGVVNGLIATYGDVITNYDGFSTGLIPVLPNHYYYLTRGTSNLCIRCLNADKTTKYKVLAPSTGTEYATYYRMPNADGTGYMEDGCGQFKTPANAAYLQFSLTSIYVTTLGDAYKVMLEDVGSIYNPNFVPSAYEPWQAPTRKIKDSALDTDTVPTNNSTKPVESGGVYDAIHNKSLKVLLIGSSHGVNTISMFPVLAYHAGINIVCGNLYTGSATLGLYEERPAVQIPYMAKNDVGFLRFAVYENGSWSTKNTTTLSYALAQYDWDVIILQRGASENRVWDDEMANYYQYVLDYIKGHCDGYTPKIYFNSGLANASRNTDRTDQIAYTGQIMSSAEEQKAEYGIDIIPVGVAVQYARATCLKDTGYGFDVSGTRYYDMVCDSQHLDTGIGQYVTGCTVFEKIVKDFFNMSIRELAYYPDYDDVSGNVVNEGSTYFTPITDYYSRIAKQCAMMAVNDGEYVADNAAILTANYGSLPTSYTITNNLTGCTNDNTATTIGSDGVYLAKLNVNSGKTMQSVKVTMGGNDITEDCYVASYSQGGTTYYYHAIRIGKITGNIVITATAS